MSVTVNPKARQILPVILGCCVIGTVFFLAITNKPHSSNYHNYVKYSYTYKEQNYTADRIEFLRLGKAPGKHVQIKCDPQNPNQIQNIYSMTICIVFLVILIITDFLLILMIKS